MTNQFAHFSQNGQLLPIDQATIPLSNIEYSYGFGVYETVRIAHEKANFLDEHAARLLRSAAIINLEHTVTSEQVINDATALMQHCESDRYNLKILLIGAPKAEEALFIILPLNPRFLEKRDYRNGVTTITLEHERPFPNAKTLNMLPSYIAYREANDQGCFDTLLINRRGDIVEGTRANIFAVRGDSLITPPSDCVLQGITRQHVLQLAEENQIPVHEEHIPLTDIDAYDGFFLTGSSAKIVPVRQIDDHALPPIPELAKRLMKLYDEHLQTAAQNC